MSEKHINKSPLVREVESKSPLPQQEGRLVVGIIPQGYKQTSIGIIPQDWEVVRLGEVCDLFAGGDVPKENFSKTKTTQYQIPIFSNGVGANALYGYTNQAKVDKPCITISARGTIGHCILHTKPFFPIVRLIVVLPSLSIDIAFLKNYIDLAGIESTNAGIPQLTIPMIRNLQIPLPPLKEQEKIARILGVWDSALTSLANLIKAKRKYKTALMQRLLTPPNAKSTHPLAPSAREGEQEVSHHTNEGRQESGDFASNGVVEKAPPLSRGVCGGVSIPNDEEQEKCPRINKGKCVESPRANEGELQSSLRFAGFSDKWQEFRLGDLFEITRGYVLPIKKIKKQQDKEYCYPVYSSQTLNGGLMGYYTNYLFENCITWTTDGANAGEVNFRAGKFYCTNVCGVLISKDGFANKCVAEIINSVSKKYVSYVGNPKLMNNVMSGIKVKIPTLAEQKKIAQVLSACDKEIETLNLKFECLKAQKRGLMQQLLSGKVRVKC